MAERETVICPNCGEDYLPFGFDGYHDPENCLRHLKERVERLEEMIDVLYNERPE